MIAYFDTSAVVPLLAEEPGSEVCLRVFLEAESVATVRMTFAETSAALARASRLGRLTADAHDGALGELESVWVQMDVLDVDDDLVRQAGALARTHALRRLRRRPLRLGPAREERDHRRTGRRPAAARRLAP